MKNSLSPIRRSAFGVRRSAFSVLLLLSLAAPSCVTPPPFIPPATNVAASTYTVQTAEHTLRAAKDTFDLFFGLVHDNHDLVVAHLPKVYAFAQSMQAKAPAALRRADAAKNAFKNNRTADNQATLNTLLSTIEQWMAETRGYTQELQANAGP